MIDFTSCRINPYRAYGGGNGGKSCILYQGENYMMKLPPKKRASAFYTNACISEYLACHIYAAAGFDVQETIYGSYRLNGREKEVVACRDFVHSGYQLIEFSKIKNGCLNYSSEDSNGYDTELATILDAIDSQKLIDPIKVRNFFWDMFIMDAYLGNFDRHNGNWGFLVNPDKELARIAPIYDCGSCLYPQIDEIGMEHVLRDSAEIENRIYVFPTSAIKENDKKINYFDYITNNRSQECTEALLRVLPRIDEGQVEGIVSACSFLSATKKRFYCTMLAQRKEKILDHARKKQAEARALSQ